MQPEEDPQRTYSRTNLVTDAAVVLAAWLLAFGLVKASIWLGVIPK